MTAADLKLRLRRVLENADTQLAAYVLHEMTKDYFVKYASEVASAQYSFGASAGRLAGRPEAPEGKP